MYPGLELLFSTLNLNSKCDAIVAFVHWTLIQNRCLCLGHGDAAGSDEVPSELLPKGWNDDQNMYTLRYVSDRNDTFFAKIIPVESSLLINITNATKNQTAAVSVLPEQMVDDFTNFRKAYKNIDKLNQEVQIIVDGLFPKPKSSASDESATSVQTNTETLKETSRSFQPIRLNPADVDPLLLGRSDLLPGDLGYGGGGMLMDPRSLLGTRAGPPRHGFLGPELPRGAIPPGARFDPFGPPIPGQNPRSNTRFGVPNPDHLQPPGGYDDMFN